MFSGTQLAAYRHTDVGADHVLEPTVTMVVVTDHVLEPTVTWLSALTMFWSHFLRAAVTAELGGTGTDDQR
jgi:hypothetical protein